TKESCGFEDMQTHGPAGAGHTERLGQRSMRYAQRFRLQAARCLHHPPRHPADDRRMARVEGIFHEPPKRALAFPDLTLGAHPPKLPPDYPSLLGISWARAASAR